MCHRDLLAFRWSSTRELGEGDGVGGAGVEERTLRSTKNEGLHWRMLRVCSKVSEASISMKCEVRMNQIAEKCAIGTVVPFRWNSMKVFKRINNSRKYSSPRWNKLILLTVDIDLVLRQIFTTLPVIFF